MKRISKKDQDWVMLLRDVLGDVLLGGAAR
jgi:hypothetical protein